MCHLEVIDDFGSTIDDDLTYGTLGYITMRKIMQTCCHVVKQRGICSVVPVSYKPMCSPFAAWLTETEQPVCVTHMRVELRAPGPQQ